MRRVKERKAFLYDDFETRILFELTSNHARDLGVWLWEDADKQRLVALSEGHSRLRDFIKSNK